MRQGILKDWLERHHPPANFIRNVDKNMKPLTLNGESIIAPSGICPVMLLACHVACMSFGAQNILPHISFTSQCLYITQRVGAV